MVSISAAYNEYSLTWLRRLSSIPVIRVPCWIWIITGTGDICAIHHGGQVLAMSSILVTLVRLRWDLLTNKNTYIHASHPVYSATHTRPFAYSAKQRTGARASTSKAPTILTGCLASSSAAWTPDDTSEERLQCSSPTSLQAPVLPQLREPPYGPVAADVVRMTVLITICSCSLNA